MTKRQTLAYDSAWPRFGVDPGGMLDFNKLFNRNNPTVIEIGFGMGKSLVDVAAAYPDINFIGIEVHPPGIGACLADAIDAGIDNLKIIAMDAVEVLQYMIPANSVQQVQILFPDPWHKKRHHKRRLINESFIELVTKKIIAGGYLRIATDWTPYADVIKEIMLQQSALTASPDSIGDIIKTRISVTKFEQRGHGLGHEITDFIYQKTAKY